MRLLELHDEFEQAMQPGGRLHADRYILSSYTLHDFLMAAMVVSLAVKEAIYAE